MPHEHILWPDHVEAYAARSDRISSIVLLRRREVGKVNEMLAAHETYTVFRLIVLLEACHAARAYLREYQPALARLIERLKEEDYSEKLIENVSKNLGVGEEVDESKLLEAEANDPKGAS